MTSTPQHPERPHDAARYDQEYRAIEASLREYFDDRLSQLGADDTMEPPKSESRFPWRVDLYFAVTIVLLALIWWRLETKAPASPAVPKPTTVEVSAPPAEPVIEDGETQGGEAPTGDASSGEAPAEVEENQPPAVVVPAAGEPEIGSPGL